MKSVFFSGQNLTHYLIYGWYFLTVCGRQPFVRLSNDSLTFLPDTLMQKSLISSLLGEFFQVLGLLVDFSWKLRELECQ